MLDGLLRPLLMPGGSLRGIFYHEKPNVLILQTELYDCTPTVRVSHVPFGNVYTCQFI